MPLSWSRVCISRNVRTLSLEAKKPERRRVSRTTLGNPSNAFVMYFGHSSFVASAIVCSDIVDEHNFAKALRRRTQTARRAWKHERRRTQTARRVCQCSVDEHKLREGLVKAAEDELKLRGWLDNLAQSPATVSLNHQQTGSDMASRDN
eukprot:6419426-Amphidinium_carterae.1